VTFSVFESSCQLQYIKKPHFRERQVHSNKGLIQSKQWHRQDFSMRGFGVVLGPEPPAAGGHWRSWGEVQLPEDGGLGQARSQPEIIVGGSLIECFAGFFGLTSTPLLHGRQQKKI